MTLKEAIIQLPWSEIDLRQAIIDYLNVLLSNLGMVLSIFFIFAFIIYTSRFLFTLGWGLLQTVDKRLSSRLRKYKIFSYLDRHSNYKELECVILQFLRRLGYMAAGTLMILTSYAITSILISTILPHEDSGSLEKWAATHFGQNMDLPAETLRYYLTFLGLVLVILVILAGFLVIVSSLGGKIFRTVAGLIMILFLLLGFIGGFFHMILGEGCSNYNPEKPVTHWQETRCSGQEL